MNLLLLTLSLVYTLGQVVDAAPAVSTVHVSFVSGNKKTQYSHGTSTGPAVVHYNLDSAGTVDTGDQLHHLHRRSISERPQQESGLDGDVPRTRQRRRYRGGQVPTSGAILLVSPTDSNAILSSASTIMTSENPTSTSTRRTNNGGVTTSKAKRRYRGPSPLTFRTTTTGYATNSPANSITTSHTSTKAHNKPRTFSSKTSSILRSSSTPTTKKTGYTGTSEDDTGSVEPTFSTTTQFPLRRLRSRVRFMGTASTTAASSLSSSSSSSSLPVGGDGDVMAASSATAESAIASTAGSLLDDMSTTVDLKNAEKNPKDTKAVKRSPYIENFESRGITFPDFDEFGGNEFGALRNFIGGSGGGGGGRGSASVASHAHANPESLSPDGVFLPPLPTEASDYAEDSHGDPYVADAETAKYAAQHPPFFAAFPHKRTVLDLNERRVEQGLEPNILRSIRPYFSFFEAANHHRHQPFPSPQQVGAHYHQLLHHDPYLDNSGKGVYANDHHEQHEFPSLIGHNSPSSTLPHSDTNSHIGGGDNYLFNTVDDHHHNDPNVLLYTHSVINSSPVSDISEAWRVFPHKRRKK